MEQPATFIENNTSLIVNMLDLAKKIKPRIFLQMSTDEVYGPAPEGYAHKEWDKIAPSNPYSASKAAQEAICFSYWRTYGIPVIITNTMNILGQLQDIEKMVPKTIRALLADEEVTVHVSPEGIPGSRFYLHARNLADAWLWISRTHEPQMYPDFAEPIRYHIVGEEEVSNVELVNRIAAILDKTPKLKFVNFHESRPGHDLRYALDGSKIAAAGWAAPVSLEKSLRETVEWSVAHPVWLGLEESNE
jgi:dTDP-glucose 4,6-dehydratase